MKKFISCVVIVLVVGCNNGDINPKKNNLRTVQRVDYFGRPTEMTVQNITDTVTGHQYIQFANDRDAWGVSDPDCVKCLKKKK